MRQLRVKFYGQHLEGSGRVTLGDEQRLSDLLNLSDRYLPLDDATSVGAAPWAHTARTRVLLSKHVVSLLVPVGSAQREELGRTRESMLVHKITSRIAVYLPALTVRGAVHHVAGADLAQHLDLRCDTFLPLTEVYVTSNQPAHGKGAGAFRAGFVLLNKDQAVAFRLSARGKVVSLRTSPPGRVADQPEPPGVQAAP